MKRWVVASMILTGLALALSGYVYVFRYDQLPEMIPTHWGIDFEPDAWVPKENLLWTFLAIPMCMAGMVVLTLVLPWLSPRHFEVDTFRSTYAYCMFLPVALLGYLHFLVLLVSWQDPLWFGRLLVAGILVFLALIGNVLGKVRRNFWIGVRTPWTLASDGVWNGTHRLAAWLFVVVGVFGAIAALAGAPGWSVFVAVLLAALIPVVYSLFLYKRLAREGRL